MGQPVISVVIAAYNASKYLKENIDSLLNQTLEDFELIYVDDGSRDNTLVILRDYAERDKRIKVITQDNHGAGHARNTGIRVAKGKYVLILDADDFFEPQMLEMTMAEAEKKQLDILIFDHYMYNEQTKEITGGGKSIVFNLIPDKEMFSAKDIPDCIFQITGVNVWNKLYRREFLSVNNIWFQEGITIDDLYFEVITLAEAEKIGILSKRFIYYRYNNPVSQMGKATDEPDSECKACEAVFKALKERKKFADLESSYTKLAYDACVNTLNRSKKNKFENVYYTVKNEWFSRLGILDKSEDLFSDSYQYEIYKNIQKMSVTDFLLWLIGQMPVVQWKYLFPAEIMTKYNNIVIYGAGAVGRDYYEQAIGMDIHKVVAWVDQRYEKLGLMGYPVVSIDNLKELVYDCIIFAFENEGLARRVMNELETKGISREKMLWIRPRINLLEKK